MKIFKYVRMFRIYLVILGALCLSYGIYQKASSHFYDVIQKSDDASQKKWAYYNLGNILVQLDLPKKAAEMYQESLRIDPDIWESKYNLERLYVFYPSVFPNEGKQASLDPEPGDQKGDRNQMGRPGKGQPDI
jgi:tetratricopeptide (TPR) repeat protein